MMSRAAAWIKDIKHKNGSPYFLQGSDTYPTPNAKPAPTIFCYIYKKNLQVHKCILFIHTQESMDGIYTSIINVFVG
jgi:hypothetical protein